MGKHSNENLSRAQSSTIRDFGNQWLIHGVVRKDFWTSDEMFKDYLCGLIDPKIITGKKVLEVGSGSGRILQMISRYNPKLLIGVEPSNGFSNLTKNTLNISNIKLINQTGANYKEQNLDIVISFGVIHHIKKPDPTLKNIYNSLKPGGIFLCWVYGRENNRIYVISRYMVSWFARSLPDKYLDKLCNQLSFFVIKYGIFSEKYLKSSLPATTYIQNIFVPCGEIERKYIVFDQLNPAYAKYYRKKNLVKVLKKAGFTEIRVEHRHKYSWTAIAFKSK